jgi:hypothetical protein
MDASLLGFQAPYLIEKLVNLRVVDAAKEAEALFVEVKRHLFLALTLEGRTLPVFSTRVDEAWHQFILFTREYHEFCTRFAGRYLHHSPRESSGSGRGASPLGFEEFVVEYECRFGPLSELWHDHLAVAPHTRLRRPGHADALDVGSEGSRAVLMRRGSPPVVLCRVDARAEPALRFISREPAFLVRELPGRLSDAERVSLARPLVQFRVLQLAL